MTSFIDRPAGPSADVCRWCRRQLPPTARPDAKACGQKCRQAAWRLRQRGQLDARGGRRMKMAYADPPYQGLAWLYKDKEGWAGEVDYAELIASLLEEYDGWALSASNRSLRAILPLCPENAIPCPWVKPIGAARATFGIHCCSETLIVVPGRELRPGKRDWLSAQPARRGGELLGRKPLAFCAWMFGLLGLQPGDQLDDLYPGSGIVTRAWREMSRTAAGDGRR